MAAPWPRKGLSVIAFDEPTGPVPPSPGAMTIRQVLRRDGWALLAAAGATLAVELGVYLAARCWGGGPRQATIAALAAAMLWVALACPILAAAAPGGFSALLRGGVVADASCVTLLVLWAVGRWGATPAYVTFPAAVEIYCTFVAVALVGIAAARCARTHPGRFAAAVGAAVLLTAALASPFWIAGPLKAAGPQGRGILLAAAVYANPFYSVCSAVAPEMLFVWHQEGRMYGISGLFDFGPPPVPWYSATIIYGSLAGILAATHLVRKRR